MYTYKNLFDVNFLSIIWKVNLLILNYIYIVKEIQSKFDIFNKQTYHSDFSKKNLTSSGHQIRTSMIHSADSIHSKALYVLCHYKVESF